MLKSVTPTVTPSVMPTVTPSVMPSVTPSVTWGPVNSPSLPVQSLSPVLVSKPSSERPCVMRTPNTLNQITPVSSPVLNPAIQELQRALSSSLAANPANPPPFDLDNPDVSFPPSSPERHRDSFPNLSTAHGGKQDSGASKRKQVQSKRHFHTLSLIFFKGNIVFPF